MTSNDLRERILEFTNDIVFDFGDGHACIVPICTNKIDSFNVYWRDKLKTYDNINDLMTDHFYDGKCLNEIADNIELL